MKNHSENFKEQIKLLGRQQTVRISFIENDIERILVDEDINSITHSYEGNILKSVMKELIIDSNVEIPNKTEIHFEYGILIDDDFEFINFGNYIVNSVEKKEDTNSFEIKCYDKMLFSMKEYEEVLLESEYPSSIDNFLKKLCNKIGLSFKSSNYANMNRQLPYDLFKGLGYTYRDVLDNIAQTTGGAICLDKNDKIEVRYITNTDDTIDEEYLKDVNVNFGEKYGPVNSIILSRSAESDNIYIKDDDSIEQNGLCELKIVDNEIMNFNDRVDYLDELADKLFGLEYYINDYTSTGIMYYDFLDRYNVEVFGKIYGCVILNDEINITQGLEENIYAEMPDESQTDYSKADKTDLRINQTYLIVDKQNQKIEAVVTQMDDTSQKFSRVEQTVEELRSEIGSITDITVYAEGHGRLELDDINESEPIYLRVYPQTYDLTPLYPSNSLYPKNDLYPHNREIVFKNTTTNEMVQYNIPCNLYYLDGVYDEFVLDYEKNLCYCIHRIEIVNGEKRIKENETTENFTYPTIALKEGNHIVSIPYNLTTYIYIRLMAKNLYTSQFATKVEMNSKIEQTESSITQSVNAKITRVDGKIDNVSGELALKIDRDENDQIVSMLNASADIIDLKANRFKVDSTYFKLTQDGHITATGGKIGGFDIGNNVLKSSTSGFASNEYWAFWAKTPDVPEGDANFRVNWNGDVQCKGLSIGSNSPIQTPRVSGQEITLEYVDGGQVVVRTANAQYVIIPDAGSSDERLKNNISETKMNCLDIIDKIDFVEYDWKATGQHEPIGVIAQRVEAISSELVSDIKTIDGENSKVFNNARLNFVNSKAIQELNFKIKELEKENHVLKEKIDYILKRMEER